MAAPAAIQYDFTMKHATAFVLTGGRSSRMGSDKALLAWGGETLIRAHAGGRARGMLGRSTSAALANCTVVSVTSSKTNSRDAVR